MPRRRPPSPLITTERDLEMLELISALRGVPIEHLADLFFLFDPYHEKTNKNPLRACERRVRELAKNGYVQLVREHDGVRRRQLVVLATRANGLNHASERKIAGRARKRRPPVRAGAHHVRTLDALAELRRDLEQRGGKVVSVKLDGDLRAEGRRGRRTSVGDKFEPMPDAVVLVQMPGASTTTKIALEYVTSKYTDADIRAKSAAFTTYDAVQWFSDRQRTSERVLALTGARCTVLT